MRGENYCWIRLFRRGCVDVEAIVLHWNLSGLVTDAAKLSIKIVSDSSFVAGDGFDVDELASEGDSVHGKKE